MPTNPAIPPEHEVEISTFRSSGPGGQKKNTTDSAVRVRHIPTGIIVVATQSRSQHTNKALALQELARRLAQRNRKARPRIPSRPTKASKKRRLESKRQQGHKKNLRKPPAHDD